MRTTPLFLAALLFAAPAAAQTYVVQSQSLPYQGITGGTLVTGWTQTGSFGATDEGTFALSLPFTFPYYMQTFTTVHINTNGFVSLSGPCVGSCYTNSAVPMSTSTPHNRIAPWWDDLSVASPSQVYTKVSTSQAEIEFRGVTRLASTSAATWKLTLTAGGLIQIHYGTITGTATTWSASAGFEDSTGLNGAAIVACGSTCLGTSYPTDTLYTIGQPMQPDLVVDQVNLNSVTTGAGMLNVSVTPTFRNYGQQPGNGFRWRAYLSTDRVYQAGTDIFLFNSSTTPVNCAGGSTVTDTGSGSIATPATGNYYVLVEVDYLNAVTEGTFGETNNFGATLNYFVQGLDLVATAVSGPANSGPGNTMAVHVNYFNQGTDPVPGTGEMGYRIYLSSDNVWSTSDYQLYPQTGDALKVISGGQTVSEDVTFTVPMTVPGGDFFYILKLDPQGLISESPTNNTAVSTAKVNVRQADLVIKSIALVDPATNTPITHALFNAPGKVRVVAANEGGADATNFKVGVVISIDTNLSLLSDTLIIESPVTQIPQGTTQTLEIPFTLPLNDKNNRPFMTGNYFFFALLDSSGQITELNEFNNNMQLMNAVLVSAPAPDLTVVRFDAPSTAGVGEAVPVYRVLKNIGNVDAPEVKYAYFLSANPAVTTDDTPVQIINGGAMIDFGRVTLAQGQVDVATELVQVPSGITPGTYYLGAVVDSAGQVAELDEANNGLGSMPMMVVPSSMRVTTTALPDAVTGRPYSFQLSVVGDTPGMPTTWSIDVTQGPLPGGMMLSQSGLITGTPTADTVVGVTVVAANNGRTAVARLALRVLPTTTQVDITTPSLPAVVNNPTLFYETFFGAAGGVKPYTWRVVPVNGETMPPGIALEANGRLSGYPRTGLMEKPYPITIEVRDSLGTVSQRPYNLRVVPPGAILFTNLAIPDGLVGISYLTDISVKNADMSALSKPLQWRLVGGALPDGLVLASESDVELIQGTPRVAGTFAFTLEVEDSKGRSDSADFLLRVYPAGLTVQATGMPTQLRPGDPVDFTFVVNGGAAASFGVFSGALPPGVTLNADGHVTGMVAVDNSQGTFNFVVEAKDPTGATGLGAFTLWVKKDAPKRGCAAVPSDAAAWALGLLALAARRRRGMSGPRR